MNVTNGLNSNMQNQIDAVWERDGERLLNKALKGGRINRTKIPFEDARREALKLWAEGISWPTVGDLEDQQRHQEKMRRICKNLFNAKSMPDCYAFAILMLLGPIHLRSPKLNCWEDCYEFLDFDDKKGMFGKVFLPPGETAKCACVHLISDVNEVACKDVEYNKDGSIGTIKMRVLHLGNHCIVKRSIIPKINDEVNRHGASAHNPSPMLKKMIYEMAKQEKKRCAMCNELNVGCTSKFDKCRDCRKKLKLFVEFIKKVKKKAIKTIGLYRKTFPLTRNGNTISYVGWKHMYQNNYRNPRTWGWIAKNDIEHIYEAYDNEKFDVNKFLEKELISKVVDGCMTPDDAEEIYGYEKFQDVKKELRNLIHYKIFFENKKEKMLLMENMMDIRYMKG